MRLRRRHTRQPWCPGQQPGAAAWQCTRAEPCGYDWCPATAQHVDARQREELGRRVADLRTAPGVT